MTARVCLAALALMAAVRPAPAAELPPAEWVLPPAALTRLPAGAAVDVSPDGAVRLSAAGRVLLYPQDDLLLSTERAVEESVWLAKGEQLVRSQGELGLLEFAPRGKGDYTLRFHALAKPPYASWRMYPGPGDSFFVVGRDAAKDVNELALWTFAGAGKGFDARVLYRSDAPIAAVAGDGERVYFAVGRGVFALTPGGKGAEAFFAHPDGDVRALAFAPGAGLFYATDSAVGYAGERGGFDVFAAPGCRLAAAKGALYVALGAPSRGVLRVAGLERFAAMQGKP